MTYICHTNISDTNFRPQPSRQPTYMKISNLCLFHSNKQYIITSYSSISSCIRQKNGDRSPSRRRDPSPSQRPLPSSDPPGPGEREPSPRLCPQQLVPPGHRPVALCFYTASSEFRSGVRYPPALRRTCETSGLPVCLTARRKPGVSCVVCTLHSLHVFTESVNFGSIQNPSSVDQNAIC